MPNNEYRVFGPPGTGKTTYLMNKIDMAKKEYGSENIFVTSFTKAAATEIVSRSKDGPNLPKGCIGTLHAHCYRALGHPELAENHMTEFGEENPQFAVKVDVDIDNPFDMSGKAPMEHTYLEMNRLRGMLIPHELWPLNVRTLYDKWEAWKRGMDYMDFTDLLEIALRDIHTAPHNPVVGFVDEAQDMTPLQFAIARQWSRGMRHLFIVGDEDQCQPEGSRVMVAGKGFMRIEDLDPDVDRLSGYHRRSGYVTGVKRAGHRFKKASRSYRGPMLTITTEEGNSMRCTPEHLCLVRWNFDTSTNVVYLMQQGCKFRIGWCQLMRNDRVFHLGTRSRLENADAAWILRICSTKKEASMWESILASRYGIPTIPFKQIGNTYYDRETIDKIFEEVGDLREKAGKCLEENHCDSSLPLWKKHSVAQGGAKTIVVSAVNVAQGSMSIPVYPGKGKGVVWETVKSVKSDHYEGTVYSLEVEDVHSYVTNCGIVTHNCIYGFLGASSESMLSPEIPQDKVVVLGQSHRIPRTVQVWAENIISKVSKRQPKAYKPRNIEGEVSHSVATANDPSALMECFDKDIREGRRVMLLASCAYMLIPAIQMLRARGVAYHNPYRVEQGAWNPVRGSTSALAAFLRFDKNLWGDKSSSQWSGDDLEKWVKLVRADSGLKRGVKSEIKKGNAIADIFDDETSFHMAFAPNDEKLDWFINSLTSEGKKRMEFPLKLLKSDPKQLVTTPSVIVGTIHSVKGGEADSVYILPDMSRPQVQTWHSSKDGMDSLRRVYYVAGTRARERLTLCQPSYGVFGFPLQEGC